MPNPIPSVTRIVTCANVDSNGCVTPPVSNPFNGDLIFRCTANCTIKVCEANQVINGTLTVESPCHVIFTGNLTVNGTVTGEVITEGSFSNPEN